MGAVNCNCIGEDRDAESVSLGDRINYTPFSCNKIQLASIQTVLQGHLARKFVK